MTNILQVRNLIKSFKDGDHLKKILNGINLDIPEGQFLSIIGESGAGKSTLIYQMSLLDVPTSGSISIFGKETSNLNIKEQAEFRLNNFGYIFQDSALIKELSVLENVKLSLLAKGISNKKAEEMSKETLTKVGIGEMINRYPSEISGGEKQRVAISRAIVGKPSIVFADEPTANLDHETSEKVMKELKNISDELKITIIMITHELEYAERADRMIEISDGNIINDSSINK